jgi:integrase
MAYLVRQPRSRYWIAGFIDASGRQIKKSTREVDKKRAQKVADMFERAAKKQGNGQVVRRAFNEFYREAYGELLPSSSVRGYAKLWLTRRRAEMTDSSFCRYEKIVEKFLHFLQSDADRDLSSIAVTHIVRFRDAQAKKLANATVRIELKTVKMMFRQARIDQYLFVDPAEGVKVPKDRSANDEPGRRAFTVDELRLILAHADDEWRSLINFGLYTGQRLGDLARLRWSQIDLERDEIRLTTGKTNKRLLLPIPPALHEHLVAIANNDDPLAPVHPKAFEIVRAQAGRVVSLSNQFSDILVAAGLRKSPYESKSHVARGIGRDGRRQGTDISFYSLRHTTVSLLRDAGIPAAVVMALVGHDTVAMSYRYTHVGKEALTNAATKLPDLLK